MKLATYRDGSRDGQLVVVSRDLRRAHYASGAATRLQQVLDDWNFISPQLEELARGLEQGRLRHAFAFDPAQCLAPLPRAYQRAALVDGSAPPDQPRLVQRPGDALSGPYEAVEGPTEAASVDFGVSLVAALGDVARGTEPPAALEAVRLLLLACELVERSDADGAPLLATAFAPVAVTPDELEGAWRAGRAQLAIDCRRGAERVGRLDAGAMAFGFGELIAALATHRRLGAGSLVGGAALVGTADGSSGQVDRTRRLLAGDALRIDGGGFGSIEPRLVPRG